jgi:uncharacterized protein (DUF433 family)
MTLTKTAYEHIAFNDAGVPVIVGTTMKVIELVLEQRAYGWSPEELSFQHPYLSMGQIHSALAYYWDHREVLDLEIAERLARAEAQRQVNPPNTLVDRIRTERRD